LLEALAAPPPKTGAASARPERLWFPRAPALPPAKGEVIEVSDAQALFAAAGRLAPGGTIVVAEGEYVIDPPLVIATDNVTLRGESGHRERVVLDGAGTLGELLTIHGCSRVTIADLTVRNVRWNGIKIDSDSGVQRLTIRNCLLQNVWQRGVRGVKVPE